MVIISNINEHMLPFSMCLCPILGMYTTSKLNKNKSLVYFLEIGFTKLMRKTLNPVIVNLYFHSKMHKFQIYDGLIFCLSKLMYSLKNVYFSKTTLKDNIFSIILDTL